MKHFCILLTFLCAALPGFAIEPPALTKPGAKQLLEVMEWRDVVVVTVRQGVSAKGEVAPVYATIIGYAMRDGRGHLIQQTVHHDIEHGWFYFELGEKVARVWTKDGFREIKPFAGIQATHRVPNP